MGGLSDVALSVRIDCPEVDVGIGLRSARGGLVDTKIVHGTPWLERAASLTPLIAARRTPAEAAFRMTPDVRQKVGAAGLFRVGSPVDGTLPMISLEEFIRVQEELAFADPSVAWAALNSNGAVLLLGRLPTELVPDVLSPSTTFVGVGLPPTGQAERADGTLRVSGRWPVVSGADDADWFMLHCIVRDAGMPDASGAPSETKFVPVPRSAVTVEDTWRGVVAVRGSGSNAVSIDAYELSEGRAVSLFGTNPIRRHALSLIDATSPFALHSLELAAIAAGIGRTAMHAALEQAGTRVSVATQASWADWPAVQNTVATAQMAIDGTRLSVFALASRCQTELDENGLLSDQTKAHVHALADHAVRVMRYAVSDLFTVGSIDALRPGHGLEQSVRDIHGFSVQWERYRRLHYSAGRVMLGLTANDPLF